MARRIHEGKLREIEEAVRQHPGGVTATRIAGALHAATPLRTVQYRLKAMVEDRRLTRIGSGRWVRYFLPETAPLSPGPVSAAAPGARVRLAQEIPLTGVGEEIQDHVRQPVQARKPVGYNRNFLDRYRPNDSFYLSGPERTMLHELGMTDGIGQPAGTYAKQALNRLLIDLSWNSSRLEGNTYSLLDTARLIKDGEVAEGKSRMEAQMILNHKDAIEFLVDGAQSIGFNRHTILNLHAALADGLLADTGAPGRLRRVVVGIQGSVFCPLAVPQIIEECFDKVLAKASLIEDPFEQAFFSMVQLPYLQPFDDVNKRVSRLATNIPLISANLSPLSFEDVPRDLYTNAILGIYELERIELLRDLFIWAYGRSAARYAAIRMSLGEPDPFRLAHRAAMRDLVGHVIRRGMDKREAATHIGAWSAGNFEAAERERFREIVERELLSVHEGNFSRYRATPSEFAAWTASWDR